MENETTMHFFCGKMAAGKSTLARELAGRDNAVLLVEDEWLAVLYPEEIQDIPAYVRYAARLKRVLQAHIETLLARGVSVVLDFPANTVEQRKWFRQLIAATGAAHVLHFIDVPDAVCKRQLQQRSAGLPPGAAFTSEAEFDAVTRYFQAPEAEEGFHVVTYSR